MLKAEAEHLAILAREQFPKAQAVQLGMTAQGWTVEFKGPAGFRQIQDIDGKYRAFNHPELGEHERLTDLLAEIRKEQS